MRTLKQDKIMPITIETKFINLLDEIASKHGFELIVEAQVSPKYVTKNTIILIQQIDSFETVVKVILTVHEAGDLDIDISSRYAILQQGRQSYKHINVEDSDHLGSAMNTVHSAIFTFKYEPGASETINKEGRGMKREGFQSSD